MTSADKRNEFVNDVHDVDADLRAIGRRIDDLGTLGFEITKNDDAEMTACRAANCLHGSLSLLRELRALVEGKSKARRKT
jgi:hypothetical protein